MVNILFFAHLQEVMGQSQITWTELPITIAELKQKLSEQHQLELESVMVAVNEEYADDDYNINDGDTIAFIPPVSGG